MKLRRIMNIDQLMLAVAVMMLATAVALGLAKRLNVGSTVALLAVGMALGPHSPWPLVTAGVDELHAVGEIGVILLLFVVGLGLKPKGLWSMRALVLGLGSGQYLLTAGAITALAIWMVGLPWPPALVMGLALAMSSTAMPVQFLQERGDSGSRQGEAVIAVDIFQSFAAIALLALMPVLAAGHAHPELSATLYKALEVCAALGAVYLLGRYVLPRALILTARSLGSGAFALIVLAAVFAAGWLMDRAGVSMALGALMIGVLLSTSPFADQVKAAANPAKQVLLGLFFMAIGMAIDLKALGALGAGLLLYLPLVLAVKLAVVLLLATVFRFGLRAALLSALLMMPLDEIGYVVFASARTHGLLTDKAYNIGLALISLSFIVSPLLISGGYSLSRYLANQDRPQGANGSADGRVVLLGYGHLSRALCLMLERAQVPYVCYETDLRRLRDAYASKHNVHYGDIADSAMMAAVALERARLVIVATGDYAHAKRMIGNLLQFYRKVPMMAAVNYLAERDELRALGVEHVVALAPEAALGFGLSMLLSLAMPGAAAEAIFAALKTEDYAALRRAGAVGYD
jgi:glutathione-regulated potassium-efflux system ancillary protein KefC